MRVRQITMGLVVAGVVAGVALLPCLIPYCQTVYALASRDLEMVFVVTDAETGEPIPHASIDLLEEEYKGNGPEQRVIKLATDDEGMARFVHEDNSCEDIIRPFRKTVTLIDLTWASVNVSAEGYGSVEQMWLHSAECDNKGHSSEDRCQRVEFKVLLSKRGDN